MAKEIFKWCPRMGSASRAQPRTKLIKFGDGYEQRVKDGINNDLRTYSVAFNGLLGYVSPIGAFLSSHGGVSSFYWTPPDRFEQSLFVCSEWSPVFQNGLIWELSAEFREVVA